MPENGNEVVDYGLVDSSLGVLSFQLPSLLTNGTVTNIDQLRLLYSRTYTNQPPLFTAAEKQQGIVRRSEYYLPVREYFWLRFWNPQDPPQTPLFWSYFGLQKQPFVQYLCIDGSYRGCSSNDFHTWAVYVADRTEHAVLAIHNQ